MKKSRFLKAPIPGENLTADTRGYPWHRPPQITDFDDAFEHVVDTVLMDDRRLAAGMTAVSNGITAVAAVEMLLTRMVGKGVVSPDMTLLLAGPVYKTFTRLLDAAGVPYLTGFDTQEEMRAYIKKMDAAPAMEAPSLPKLTKAQRQEMEEITEEAKAEIPTGGLMGAPSAEESVEIPMEEETAGAGLIEPMQEEEDMA